MSAETPPNHKSHAPDTGRECYSYDVDQGDDGVIYCSFTTKDADFTVYFNHNEYTNKVSEYPHLLHNAYGFGFFSFPKDGVGIPEIDSKVKHTIELIICNFYNDAPDAVLLYHCYYIDGKQHKRSMKFDRWYCGSPSKDAIRKHEINLEILTDGVYIKHYIGYLCSNANKNIDAVNQEFETFGLAFRDDKLPF